MEEKMKDFELEQLAAEPDVHRLYSMEANQVLDLLNSSLDCGLTSMEAETRLEQFGENSLKKKGHRKRLKTIGSLLFRHMVNYMSFILFAAIAISVAVKQYVDAVVIALLITFYTTVGFAQDYSSEKTMRSLMKASQPQAMVFRDKQQQHISMEKLVPGDIVILKEGDKIPADLRFIEVIELECDESFLTGESTPSRKTADALEGELPVGDRTNYGFMTATVTKGKGKGVVVATGKKTELGKIANMIGKTKKVQTQLEKVSSFSLTFMANN